MIEAKWNEHPRTSFDLDSLHHKTEFTKPNTLVPTDILKAIWIRPLSRTNWGQQGIAHMHVGLSKGYS